jgi:CRISPR-associated protein Csm3|uniref:CRISPR system Cms endoribonuclease Csm3 n=1 Tax=Leptospirillum ferrodiazotrophum TaxID=412449 RepID=C6HZN5_9BACT|nr:MAG: CRISPR-associated RAMP protein, Csm3 family [Leptospirillum ferrodiazotrophum]
MRLTDIQKMTGTLELVTGLHIGAGNTEMHIGGTDNPVIKNPITHQPYIPGSSLKGKMRSLLEWDFGFVGITDGGPLGFSHLSKLKGDVHQGEILLSLFGGAPEGSGDEIVEKVGPSRLLFWDCSLSPSWVQEMSAKNLLLTETKMENTIDRIKGVAQHPRNTERVPAGARFDFALTIRIHDGENHMKTILRGLRLLELTGLGGSGSRGYGKISFSTLSLGGKDLRPELDAITFSDRS